MLLAHGNKKLKKALSIEDQGQRHRALVTLAQEIGVSVIRHKGGSKGYGPAAEPLLVARIRDAIRTDAACHSVIAAAVSAIIALLSVVAAWLAVAST